VGEKRDLERVGEKEERGSEVGRGQVPQCGKVKTAAVLAVNGSFARGRDKVAKRVGDCAEYYYSVLKNDVGRGGCGGEMGSCLLGMVGVPIPSLSVLPPGQMWARTILVWGDALEKKIFWSWKGRGKV